MEENYRICYVCGTVMASGYVVEDGLEYFCSNGCLETVYPYDEYMDMYEDGCAYWTEWEID